MKRSPLRASVHSRVDPIAVQADPIDANADALRDTLVALAPLSFEERMRIIRWACEFYGIANVALYQGDGTFKGQRG